MAPAMACMAYICVSRSLAGAKSLNVASWLLLRMSNPPAQPSPAQCTQLCCLCCQTCLVLWRCVHVPAGGYGGMRGDLALDPRKECIQAPGLKHVLCTSWRNDNSGAHLASGHCSTVIVPLMHSGRPMPACCSTHGTAEISLLR